jgi:hypothetical protein
MYLVVDQYGGPAKLYEDLTHVQIESLGRFSFSVYDIFDPEEPLEFRSGEWHVIPKHAEEKPETP